MKEKGKERKPLIVLSLLEYKGGKDREYRKRGKRQKRKGDTRKEEKTNTLSRRILQLHHR